MKTPGDLVSPKSEKLSLKAAGSLTFNTPSILTLEFASVSAFPLYFLPIKNLAFSIRS